MACAHWRRRQTRRDARASQQWQRAFTLSAGMCATVSRVFPVVCEGPECAGRLCVPTRGEIGARRARRACLGPRRTSNTRIEVVCARKRLRAGCGRRDGAAGASKRGGRRRRRKLDLRASGERAADAEVLARRQSAASYVSKVSRSRLCALQRRYSQVCVLAHRGRLAHGRTGSDARRVEYARRSAVSKARTGSSDDAKRTATIHCRARAPTSARRATTATRACSRGTGE